MSYLAIYRKFRPKTFDEMIGQEHIVKTLTNQIQSGHVGHAYLFCGTRGTGKTTTAKIFAKAINCEHPVNGSPCGKCPTCIALNDPANLDILEMDAASNNKVENVREIRDKVQYPPVAGKYKVYIIDEVHMLTAEAFNALLKTLEEPPKHAVFILATTEQHKLPATILSRCMRFDFKLVPDKQIASLIEKIYDEVGRSYEKEAVAKIAASGEGCVRDALSVADLCLSSGGDKLTYNDVIDVLGASDNATTYKLVDGILSSDASASVALTEKLCSSGKSVGLMCKDVQSVLRDVLIVKTCKNYADVLSLPASELETLKALSEKTSEHAMLRVLEIFSSLESDLKYSSHPKVVIETAVLKATLPSEDYNVDALIRRIDTLERELAELKANGIKAPLYVDKRQIPTNAELEKEQKGSPVKQAEKDPVKEEVKPAAFEKEDEGDEEDVPPFDMDDAPADIGEEIDDFFKRDLAAEAETASTVKAQERPADKPAEKPAERLEEKPTKKAVEVKRETSQTKAPINAMRLWGVVVRRLRADKNIMLWIACQDAETAVQGGDLNVILEGENEYNLLSKKENVEILQSIVASECDLKVVIRKKGETTDTFEEDIAKAKEVLGEVTIKD